MSGQRSVPLGREELDALRQAISDEMSPEDRKQVIKEAINEWLEEKFAALGKWTARGLFALGLAAFAYFVLTHTPWKPL